MSSTTDTTTQSMDRTHRTEDKMSNCATCYWCDGVLVSDDEQEEGICDRCYGSIQSQINEERRHPDDDSND